jgi:dTDP-4-dehydrorhamnose reductase
MLGHQLLRSWQDLHDLRVTLRGSAEKYERYGLFTGDNAFFGVDVLDFATVSAAVHAFKPEAIVNAVGIVKQRAEASDAILSIEVNSLLPHRLSQLCSEIGARLVHLSTDCVFSGSKGMYIEDDLEDARDLYGRSKLLGEVEGKSAVTLRTSIIGMELSRNTGLIEWFLAQRGDVSGFTRAVYSGFTTMEMARIINNLLTEHPDLHGVWQVASDPIDKFSLLEMLQNQLGDGLRTLIRNDEFVCDRSLDGRRFSKRVGYKAPSWEAMLGELADQIKARGDTT